MADKIDEIIAKKKSGQETPDKENKFSLIVSGGNLQENFLELQFKNGLRTCFSYSDLTWFNFDPDAGCIDLEFGGFLVTIKGRGLYPALFTGFKNKQVAWVKEADSEMQDNKENENFVEEITVTPPKGFGGDEPAE
jgi:hypothetical protein